MKPKRTDKEKDSTYFLIAILLAFGGYLYACITIKEFRESDLAGQLLILFNSTFLSMREFFFKNRRNEGGDYEPSSPEQPSQERATS